MDIVDKYMKLYEGRTDAFGTGEGRWVKRSPTRKDFEDHLAGKGHGLGIAPLRDDGTVMWAAIDLDEPDFDTAVKMQGFIPGSSWVERSRSGNAHVLVFFSEPIQAWIPRGILRYACEAAEKGAVEIFPKQDRLLPGMLGNYLNLSYHGENRPVLLIGTGNMEPLNIVEFVDGALESRNDPHDWEKRARWLGLESPDARDKEHGEFGTRPFLHICAEHIIAEREHNPIVEGHRAVVFFNLARQLLNYEGFDDDEVKYYMCLVNDASPDPIQEWEIDRMIANVKRGQFTSTGCDDPLFSPYAHPDCPIAHGRS